jgi:hypothetical protein
VEITRGRLLKTERLIVIIWGMRKAGLALLSIIALIFSSIPVAQAALNAEVNLDNPRVVPLFGQESASQVSTTVGWSGFLYSPRIILSAAHSHYRFDNSRNRVLSEAPFITVGKPNSSAKDTEGRVKVVKTFVGNYRLGSIGGLDDFIVLVLEKDLVSVPPAKLMTPEIEEELVNARAEVSFHGYGEYRDRCAPGQTNPCPKDRNNPNHGTSELPRINKINLAPKSAFPWLQGDALADAANETLVSNHKACSGDSGGPITTNYKGDLLYLGQGLNGMNVYACGAGNGPVGGGHPQEMGLFSPVHRHLGLIKQAEEFVANEKKLEAAKQEADAKAKAEAEAKAAAELKAKQEAEAATKATAAKKITITCVKGKTVKKVTAVKPKCPTGYKKK